MKKKVLPLILFICLTSGSLFSQEPDTLGVNYIMSFMHTVIPMSVADGAGDLNGDGYDDLVIEKAIYGSGEDSLGEVHIHLGGAEMDTIPDYIITEQNDGKSYAGVCNIGGDINGDGINDLIITDYQYSGHGIPSSGRVFIYLGRSDFSTTADYIIDGINFGDAWTLEFGWRVRIGDLNGDSYDDLVISGPGPTGHFYGQINLFLGGPDFDIEPDWRIVGESGDLLGKELELGDINGDGCDDIITKRGWINYIDYEDLEIYAGGKEMSQEPVWTERKEQYSSFRSGGDLNGDGNDELVYYARDTRQIYFGKEDFSITSEFDVTDYVEGPASPRFANINDDVFCDIVINPSLPGEEPLFYIFKGCKDFNPAPDFNPDYLSFNYPSLQMFIGDINADGTNDYYKYVYHYSTDDPSEITHTDLLIYNITGLNSIDDGSDISIPDTYNLTNYPNPFNPSTTISYELNTIKNINIAVFNAKGERVWETGNRSLDPATGKYSVLFDGAGLNSGIYFYTLEADGVMMETRKMVLIK